MSGGLRKLVGAPHVRVPRPTVRNTEVSFRALGVLAWILDRPEGWDIRAEQMASEGKRPDGTGPGGKKHRREGREAIRTCLRELAEAGYYRLERRRMRDGTFAMGTAISDVPVPSWVEQREAFKGGAVPVVEQDDGAFLVRYPDGSLLPDDCPPPEIPSGLDEEDVPAGQTGDGFPGPGKAESGGAGSGNASPKEELVKSVSEEEPPHPRKRGGESPKPEEPQAPPPAAPASRCVHGRAACRPCGTTPRQVANAQRKAETDAAEARRRAGPRWCGLCLSSNRRLMPDQDTGSLTVPCPHCHPDGPRVPPPQQRRRPPAEVAAA